MTQPRAQAPSDATAPATPAAVWLPWARERVRRALSLALVERELTVLQIPAPLLSVERALAALHTALDDGADVVWDPPLGPAFASVGAAARLRATPDLASVRDDAKALWARVRQRPLDDDAGPPARLFGGLAFVGGGAVEPPWQDFGDGEFRLPRYRYARESGRAWLAIAVGGDEANTPDEAQAQADGVLCALDAAARGSPASPADAATAPRLLSLHQLDLAGWTDAVDSALAGVRQGRFEKVVAARRAEVIADRPFDVLRVLARLQESAQACTRFAFRVAAATFLGASPERLVTRRGPIVLSEALAGSIGAGRAAGSAELLASAKDLVEHAVVVREITRRLAPRCIELDVPARPRVRALRHVLHLHTPIEGRLREPTHVLDLVAALHPTPAVAGVPREDALAWIVEHEPVPRGWYAGPVGWFDADGDGEFVVALRSAVVRGARAWLWAGAGIVADSTPASEYAETALKQRAILDALGAGAAGAIHG